MPVFLASAGTGGGSGITSTPGFTRPSGLDSNEHVLVSLITSNAGITITPPSGFVLIRETALSLSKVASYYKYIEDIEEEPVSYVFTLSTVSRTTGTIVRITGARDGGPADEDIATDTNQETITAVELTAQEDESLAIVVAMRSDAINTSPTLDDGNYSQVTNSVNGNIRATSYYDEMESFGSIGTPTADYANVCDELYFSSFVFQPPGMSGRFEPVIDMRGVLHREYYTVAGRFEVGADLRGAFAYNVSGRFELGTDFFGSMLRDHTVRGRFEVATDFLANLSKEFHILSGRFEVNVRMKTGYIGRGTGLVIYFPDHLTERDEIGAYQYQKFINQLRVGSEFSGFFPLVGTQGKTGKVRILSMKYSEDKELPEYEIELVEHQDSAIINHLKQASSTPFIPKMKGSLFRNVAQLRRNQRRN